MGAFEIRRTMFGTLEVVLRAPNGEELMSSPPVSHVSEAEGIVARIRSHANLDACYDRQRTPVGRYIFTLRCNDGKPLGMSTSCATPVELEGFIASVKVNAPDSPLKESSGVQAPGRGGRS